jgi:neutral ceramidase
MKSSNATRILLGAAKADITPTLGAGLLMSSKEERWKPFESVRLPLHARALAIQARGRSIALVSLDILGLAGIAVGGWDRFQRRVCAAAANLVTPENLILTATHTHSSPESLGLTNINKEPAFKKWVDLLVVQIGRAIRNAFQTLQPCSIKVGHTEANLSVHRRILTTQGIVLSNEVPYQGKIIERKAPVDDRVNVMVALNKADKIVAFLVNATCHPIHEMCIPRVSPDYPGEMCIALEGYHVGATAFFFNGAAGNVNPPTACGGPGHARHHGFGLAFVAEQAVKASSPINVLEFSIARSGALIPTRRVKALTVPNPVSADISAVRLGNTAFLFLPGEPFVETGLAIRRKSPFPNLFIVGYAGNTVGYIPTNQAYHEGGYEIGPGRWSYLARGCETIVRKSAIALLKRLWAK